MTIFTTTTQLAWGEMDVPMCGISQDWQGRELTPPAAFSLVADPFHLWFLANHRQPADLHPRSRPGVFQADLWHHDVAELFLCHPTSGRYFEFNLAPNGAWWTCEFTGPRERAEPTDIAMPEIATFAEMAPDGSWLAAMAIPLHLLRARLDFGESTTANVAMILNSPNHRFFSAGFSTPGTPDFHQPAHFPPLSFAPLPKW